ncbi:hypothetical protein [Umezawaea tangerina]|uniref:hypothetical protein n=1 Tax=Umezawaea tangerina TaxID=84725 RepID=UPI000D06E70C|nr:hypothetical protein [Umezawaea tangerina]
MAIHQRASELIEEVVPLKVWSAASAAMAGRGCRSRPPAGSQEWLPKHGRMVAELSRLTYLSVVTVFTLPIEHSSQSLLWRIRLASQWQQMTVETGPYGWGATGLTSSPITTVVLTVTVSLGEGEHHDHGPVRRPRVQQLDRT